MVYLTVSEAARQIGAIPRDISDLFYLRKLPDDSCPIIAGRRGIPLNCLDAVRVALLAAGKPADPVTDVVSMEPKEVSNAD